MLQRATQRAAWLPPTAVVQRQCIRTAAGSALRPQQYGRLSKPGPAQPRALAWQHHAMAVEAGIAAVALYVHGTRILHSVPEPSTVLPRSAGWAASGNIPQHVHVTGGGKPSRWTCGRVVHVRVVSKSGADGNACALTPDSAQSAFRTTWKYVKQSGHIQGGSHGAGYQHAGENLPLPWLPLNALGPRQRHRVVVQSALISQVLATSMHAVGSRCWHSPRTR
jgi:hypothetical protein